MTVNLSPGGATDAPLDFQIRGSGMNRRVFLFGALAVGSAAHASSLVISQEKGRAVLGQDRGHVVMLNPQGEIIWEKPCPGTSHDISLLPNGNILVQTRADNVVELNKAGDTVWRWDGKPTPANTERVEIHAFQRLRGDVTMIAESGNKRIIEVDKNGKILKEIPLTVNNPNPHRDTRMVRRTPKNTYLVCHEADATVREYDDKGKVIWFYTLDLNNQPRTPNHDGHGTEVFGAIRLKSGNTLIGGGNNNRVLEVTPEGKIVWSIERDELPGIHLCWVTTVAELPNGNRVFGNCHAGPDNPQLIEVNREKKVVWSMKNHTVFGNDLASATIIDVKGINR